MAALDLYKPSLAVIESQSQKMWPLVFFIVSLVESLLSFSMNSFIVMVHVLHHRRGMSPSDVIQLAMGVTNLSMRGFTLVKAAVSLIPMSRQIKAFQLMVVLAPFHMYFNFWLIAWLSTLYWTRITNLHQQIFVWIKRGLSSFTPHILLISALVSLAISLLPIWVLHFGAPNPNSTISALTINLTGFNVVPLSCANICLSFSIILVSLSFTVSSLLSHMWSLRRNGSGHGSSSVQAHVSAVRTMTLLLLLSIIVSAAILIIFNPPHGVQQSVIQLCWLILDFFPSLEASIIIQSSPKLRKMFLQVFCAGRFWKDLCKE